MDKHISVVFPRLKKWRERYEEAIECGFDLLPNEIVFQHGSDFAVLYVLDDSGTCPSTDRSTDRF